MKKFLLMAITILGLVFSGFSAGWLSYPTVSTLNGPETFLTTTPNPTNNQQISASSLLHWISTNIQMNQLSIGYITTNSPGMVNTNLLVVAGFGTAAVNGNYTNVGIVLLNGLYSRYVYTNTLNNGVFMWTSLGTLQWYIGTNQANQSYYQQSGSGAGYAPTNVWSWNSSGPANSTVGTVAYYNTGNNITNYFTNSPVVLVGRTNISVTVISNIIYFDSSSSNILTVGVTNFSNYGNAGVVEYNNNTSFDFSGLMSEHKFHHVADNFDYAVIGYDDNSNTSEAGQIALIGNATLANGNLCGFHVIDVNDPSADKRAFVLRVKSANPGSAGGYTLFENKLTTSSPAYNDGFTQIYNNWLVCDEFGRVGLGELGQASDATGTALHPPFLVTVFGSYSGAVPAFGFGATGGNYVLGTATNGAIGYNGSQFFLAPSNTWYQVITIKDLTNGVVSFAGTKISVTNGIASYATNTFAVVSTGGTNNSGVSCQVDFTAATTLQIFNANGKPIFQSPLTFTTSGGPPYSRNIQNGGWFTGTGITIANTNSAGIAW